MPAFNYKYTIPMLVLMTNAQCTNPYYTGKKEDFLNFSKMDYDLRRLPLSYPYQLLTAYDVNEMLIDDELQGVCNCSGNMTDVNVQDSWILLKGDLAMRDESYCAVNLRDSNTLFMDNQAEFSRFCDSFDLKGQLYPVKDSYVAWMETDSLPWR